MQVEIHSHPIAYVSVEKPFIDNRVYEAIRQAFRKSSYWELRTVNCSFHKGVAVLRGTVSSYFIKHVA